MIFPRKYYRPRSYLLLLLIHLIPMLGKYLKILTSQALSIFKRSNKVEDLTFPKFSSDKNDFCNGCHFCEKICPTSAIKLEFKGKKLQSFRLDLLNCTRCQICILACPEALIAEMKMSLRCLDISKDELYLESAPNL
jgi:formate hydrogenlyase subunit 6/NADH:ubiquinone oxidoreductase subunit I